MNIVTTFGLMATNWLGTLKKYPLVFLGSFLLCTYLSYIISTKTSGEIRVGGSLAILSLLWLSTYIAKDSFIKNYKYKFLLFFIAPIIAALIYFTIPATLSYSKETKIGIGIFTTIVLMHLFIALIPTINNYEEKRFLNYNLKLLENFTESALLNLIFYGILCIAVYGITTLFDLKVNYRLYGHLFIWIAGILHTANFMSNFPNLENENLNALKFDSRFFKALVLYILIPSTIIYAGIIYAYTVKLSLASNIKPWLLEMCTWYFVVGFFTYYLTKVFTYSNENKLSTFFIKYFPIMSVLIAIVMLVACYNDIHKYGVKESNYFLSLLTVAAVITLISFLFKSNIDKRILPLSLIILGIISITPSPINLWNSVKRNQENRLIDILSKNEMIKNGNITKHSGNTLLGYDTLSTALYALENINDNQMIKSMDKDSIIKTATNPYDIMNALNIKNYNTATNDTIIQSLNKSFNHLPKISLISSTEILPLLNTYSIVTDTFSGIKVQANGNIDIYQNGENIETLIQKSYDLNKQYIILEAKDKSRYTLYFQHLYYRLKENKIIIEDVTGVVVK
jgi:hypothetical protein